MGLMRASNIKISSLPHDVPLTRKRLQGYTAIFFINNCRHCISMDFMQDEMHNADYYLCIVTSVFLVGAGVVISFLFPLVNYSYMLFCYPMIQYHSFVIG